ncbi:MAG: hypothetical protein AAGA36_12505 [Pseudomonadota bacterium]
MSDTSALASTAVSRIAPNIEADSEQAPGAEAGPAPKKPPQQPAPPPFKEPAISLSPKLAGIKVGDLLTGTVERIDAQARAVVQNAAQTVLVDPAATLKPNVQARILVTQTAPKFLGQIPAPAGGTPTPVQLALVAIRGIEQPVLPEIPAPTRVEQAIPQPLKTAQDLAATLTKGPVKVATPSSPATPVLMQATVTVTAPTEAAFITRHPFLKAIPSPLPLTLLPASPSRFAVPGPPAPASPFGQLIKQGTALLATVTQAPERGETIARAGGIEIKLPSRPDADLKAGDRLILVSAAAQPRLAAPSPIQISLPSLTPLVQSLPQLPTGTTAALLSQVLGLALENQKEAATLKPKEAQAEPSVQKPKSVALPKPVQEELEQLQRRVSEILLSSTAPAAADGPALPLIIPTGDTSLIASLFQLTANQDNGVEDDRETITDDQSEDDTAFEVAITFEQFGLTRLSGTINKPNLDLTLETEKALPEVLKAELIDVFENQCEACGLGGMLKVKSLAGDANAG